MYKMYKLCPHIDIEHGTPDERADTVHRLPTRSLLHLLNCIPLDPLPQQEFAGERNEYMANSLRIAISQIIRERA